MSKIFEPVSKPPKEVSEEVKKTITEISIKNNKAKVNLNNKVLEIMNVRGILASYLLSPSSKITNLENSTQFRLVKNLVQIDLMIC